MFNGFDNCLSEKLRKKKKKKNKSLFRQYIDDIFEIWIIFYYNKSLKIKFKISLFFLKIMNMRFYFFKYVSLIYVPWLSLICSLF